MTIQIPTPNQDLNKDTYSEFFRTMGAYLGVSVKLLFDSKESVYRFLWKDKELVIAYISLHDAYPDSWVKLSYERDGYDYIYLSTSKENPVNGSVFHGDIILPALYSFSLFEERQFLHRDTFGLVEGKNSYRAKWGMIIEPLFENVSIIISDRLGISRKSIWGSKQYAIGASFDIDSLETDHLCSVIEYILESGVEKPTFFIYGGCDDSRTIRDPEYDIAKEEYTQKISVLKEYPVEIGLHGSYLSHDKVELMYAQKKNIETHTGQVLNGYRSHYLRFAYPRTWITEHLCGLNYDATLGYPDTYGLRSAISIPYYFSYPDAFAEKHFVIPTALLDQHFFWPEPIDISAQKTILNRVLNRIARVNGCFTIDYHTYTYENLSFSGWWNSYRFLIEKAKNDNAFIGGLGCIKELYDKHRNGITGTEKAYSVIHETGI